MQKKSSTITSTKHRGDTIHYVLPLQSNEKVKVCKKFFLSTLSVSDRMISYNLKVAKNGIRKTAPRPPPCNKIGDNARQTVRDHINSFYRVESHYCRSDTSRQYLEAGLNKTKMFRLYEESEYYNRAVKQHLYSEIFDTEFNLGFHHPTKDLCDFCDRFNKANDANLVTEELMIEKESHERRKLKAREAKTADKENPGIAVFTFDLQQVLTCPKL